MSDFKFQQYVAPVQKIDTDASGGHGGDSLAVAYGNNTSTGGAGGEATGGAGGTSTGGAGKGEGEGGHSGDPAATATGTHVEGDVTGDSTGDPGDTIAKALSGDGGKGVGVGVGGDSGSADGGTADAHGGDATAGHTVTSHGGDGGAGGTATVNATQSTPVTDNFSFTDSFNEDNHVTLIKDSFHFDNDGVDNQGGTIEHSVVGDDFEDSFKHYADSWDIDVHHPMDGAM